MTNPKNDNITIPTTPVRLIIGAAVLGLMAAGVFIALVNLTRPVEGLAFNIPSEVKNLELTSATGDPIRVNDLRGKYTLISFGYTHCPDVCPVTLTDYKRVKRELSETQQDKINFAFVSVDGERDTPEYLNRYLTRFDPEFIGMTTDDDALMRQMAEGFNVYYEKRELENTEAAYLVDHTATLFLLNPRGNVVQLYPFGTPPTEIAADIAERM